MAAKATVEGVYDDRLKPVAQCLIGGVQVKSGDLIGAKTTVEEIGASGDCSPSDISLRSGVPMPRETFAALLYCRIARAQADAEDMTGSRRSLC